ncbi:MAG: hypothetical protein R2838_18090 [Caldilineaceae bacterium]
MRVKTAYSVAGNLVTGVVLGARDAVSPTVALQAGPATVETDVLLPALQLTLSDGLVSTTPGAEVTYQVTAANAGAARRTVQMTFTLPTARDLVVAVSDGGGLQTPGGTTITWPAFDVPANAGRSAHRHRARGQPGHRRRHVDGPGPGGPHRHAGRERRHCR